MYGSTHSQGWRRDVLLLTLAIGLLFGIGLGARPYMAPSEARYIEIPRQMLVTNDWVTPHINGVKYFEKPPLFYWTQALQLKFFGLGEFSGRFWVAFSVLLTCLITYATGRMLHGRWSGLAAALILATSLLGYGLSRMVVLDVPLTLFLTATLACFLAARYGNHPARWYYAMYVCAALAALTKGLIGIVLPGLIVGLWIIIANQWKVLRDAKLVSGLLLFLMIAAPWHMLVGQRNPEFWNFYFIHEHVTRYLSDGHKRSAPWWFFIVVTLAGLLPWTVFLPAAIRQAIQRIKAFGETRDVTWFLLLWILVPLVFFSLSHSKLLPYIFPIFPPLALLLGRTLTAMSLNTARKHAVALAVLLAGLSAAYFTLPALHVKKQALFDAARQQALPLAWLMAGAAVVLLFACWRRWHAAKLLIVIGVYAVLFDAALNGATVNADTNSVKSFSEVLNERLKPEDEVIAYETYYQDLPVYLNHNVTVVEWAGELSFGVEQDPSTRSWMISREEFWKRCRKPTHALYVLMPQNTYATFKPVRGCSLHPIFANDQNILLTTAPK